MQTKCLNKKKKEKMRKRIKKAFQQCVQEKKKTKRWRALK